jgi:hypothetical protein
MVAMPLLLAPLAAHAAPATPAEMGLYTRIGAVNVCISRAAGIDFEKSVGIAGETIAQLIQGQHDGVISQVGDKPLGLDDLRKGSINSAVLGAAEICPKEVPADVMAKVQAALKPAPAAKPASAPAAKPSATKPSATKPSATKPASSQPSPSQPSPSK